MFGLFFAGIFLAVGLWPILSRHEVRWWALAVCGILLLLALLFPRTLAFPNRLWMRLGLVLGSITGVVALLVLYFVVVTPTGMLMRLLGKDPLRLRFDSLADSYWIGRQESGSTDMTQQF